MPAGRPTSHTREIGLGHGGSLNTRIKEFVRPTLTNQSIRGAVQDYLAGGARKQGIVHKYGDISNWDVSNVTNMNYIFSRENSFNQPLNAAGAAAACAWGRVVIIVVRRIIS